MGCSELRGKQDKKIRILGMQEVNEYKCNSYFCGISTNQRYLAYFFFDKINIVNLQTSKKIKEFQMKTSHRYGSYLDYFENGRMLCCAIYSSRIQIYRADNHYQLINTIYGQNGLITGLKIINQNQILICDNDCSVIVIDSIKKCQILKIRHDYNKNAKRYVEFDSQNQVIIFHQANYINFYKMNGETAIHFDDQKIYYRIQIINNANRLISSCFESVVLWQMDFKQKKLIKLREFLYQSRIYGAQFLFSSLFIILDQQFMIILDTNDFKITYRQRHYFGYDKVDKETQLTTTSNHHLIIRSQGSLEIFKIITM